MSAIGSKSDDYLIEFLETWFSNDAEEGFREWQRTFRRASWQNDLCHRLLSVAKGWQLSEENRASLRNDEGIWLAQRSEWALAEKCCRRCQKCHTYAA
jgi:hypothetical protein